MANFDMTLTWFRRGESMTPAPDDDPLLAPHGHLAQALDPGLEASQLVPHEHHPLPLHRAALGERPGVVVLQGGGAEWQLVLNCRMGHTHGKSQYCITPTRSVILYFVNKCNKMIIIISKINIGSHQQGLWFTLYMYRK